MSFHRPQVAVGFGRCMREAAQQCAASRHDGGDGTAHETHEADAYVGSRCGREVLQTAAAQEAEHEDGRHGEEDAGPLPVVELFAESDHSYEGGAHHHADVV